MRDAERYAYRNRRLYRCFFAHELALHQNDSELPQRGQVTGVFNLGSDHAAVVFARVADQAGELLAQTLVVAEILDHLRRQPDEVDAKMAQQAFNRRFRADVTKRESAAAVPETLDEALNRTQLFPNLGLAQPQDHAPGLQPGAAQPLEQCQRSLLIADGVEADRHQPLAVDVVAFAGQALQ